MLILFLGTLKIVHSDNTHEFMNEVIHNFLSDWPGETTIINERPRKIMEMSSTQQFTAYPHF